MQFVDAQVDDSLPAFAAVRSVQVCPSNRDLILVSGCADNYIKVLLLLLLTQNRG